MTQSASTREGTAEPPSYTTRAKSRATVTPRPPLCAPTSPGLTHPNATVWCSQVSTSDIAR